MAGPPQLVQMGFLMASLRDMFSALSLSFSCRSKEFSCRSSWVCKISTSIITNKNEVRSFVHFFFGYLHLSSSILEPELDLSGLQAKPPTELQPLLLIGMWALLEQTENQPNRNPRLVVESNHLPELLNSEHEIILLELLDLLWSVSVVSLLPRRLVVGVLVVTGCSTLHVIRSGSALVLLFH